MCEDTHVHSHQHTHRHRIPSWRCCCLNMTADIDPQVHTYTGTGYTHPFTHKHTSRHRWHWHTHYQLSTFLCTCVHTDTHPSMLIPTAARVQMQLHTHVHGQRQTQGHRGMCMSHPHIHQSVCGHSGNHIPGTEASIQEGVWIEWTPSIPEMNHEVERCLLAFRGLGRICDKGSPVPGLHQKRDWRARALVPRRLCFLNPFSGGPDPVGPKGTQGQEVESPSPFAGFLR